MARTQNVSIIQGDTARWVIPVLDGDDPNTKFLDPVGASIEFAISDGPQGSVLVDTAAVTTTTKPFGDTTVGVESYPDLDTIPDTQDVVVVTVPASETAPLLPGDGPLAYQCRLVNSGTGTVVSVVRGEVQVTAAPLE